jgi:prolyl-tRNA editing enzyme YbaK/EbsC (Cys-tRNA(Pro) deacylase)
MNPMIHVCTHARTRIDARTHKHARKQASKRALARTQVVAPTYTHTHTHARARAHTHTMTHTHEHLGPNLARVAKCLLCARAVTSDRVLLAEQALEEPLDLNAAALSACTVCTLILRGALTRILSQCSAHLTRILGGA